jgi:tRNA pseudouridine55 synthase
MKPSPSHGLLVIDKPGDMTSRAVVNRVQRWFPRGTSLGHTGTLDPLATGVLVICVAAATRLAEYVQRMDKVYQAVLQLGVWSDTDDADGTIRPAMLEAAPPAQAVIADRLRELVGVLDQVPPVYSAAHVSGRRAYDLARRHQEVQLSARQVRVYDIELVAYDFPDLDVRVHCGKGTYIRALARDLGQRLGCGALVRQLRRTRVGPFDSRQALGLETNPARARNSLLPLSKAVAELKSVRLEADALARFCQGQVVACPAVVRLESSNAGEVELAVFDEHGSFIGVGRTKAGQSLAPYKVFSSAALSG